MTRRLLAFFAPGLLMAQDPNFHGYPMGRAKRPRPTNGQCPVCGTMAEKFVPGQSSTQGAFYPGLVFGVDREVVYHRITFCAHCNTTFRQWAEGKEPKR